MKLTKLNFKGDTVAEVMICLTVLALMLVSAYTLTNRSQLTAQSSQERSRAVKIAEEQIEMLRSFTDNNSLPTANNFCMQRSGTSVNTKSVTNVSALNTYPTECRSAGDDQRYSFTLWNPSQARSIGGNGDAYAVTVRWDGLKNTQQEEVKIFYEIYNFSNPAFASTTTRATPRPACSDGANNDSDTFIDHTSNRPAGEQADPGCSSPTDRDERDEVTVTLELGAHCYASSDANSGCPTVNAVYNWSDGQRDTRSIILQTAHQLPTTSFSGASGNWGNYAETFQFPGTPPSLVSVELTMATDRFDGTPATDRNALARAVNVSGTRYTTALPRGCGTAEGWATYGGAYVICGADTTVSKVILQVDPPVAYNWSTTGSNRSACVSTEPVIGDTNDGCFTSGSSTYMFRQSMVTYDLSGVKNGYGYLQINYGQYGTVPGVPATGYTAFNVTGRFAGSSNSNFNMTLPIDRTTPSNRKLLVPINLSGNESEFTNLTLDWTNNLGSDPNLQIDAVYVCRFLAANQYCN